MNNFALVKQEIMSPAIKKMVGDRLGEKSGSFITSVLDLIGSEKSLMQCDPKLVMKEAMKAAALDLPISRSLGFAYVIPYKQDKTPIPQFQMGFKGYIQLALRTGQYRHLNAGAIYEGEEVKEDRLKGTIKIVGEKSGSSIGYFAYMQLVNGFEKAIYCTKEEIESHRNKFSKAHNRKDSAWQTDFDSMAKKTMLLKLIPKYGPMNVEMSHALESDSSSLHTIEDDLSRQIDGNGNGDIIDIEVEKSEEQITPGLTDEEKAEIEAQEAEEAKKSGPRF